MLFRSYAQDGDAKRFKFPEPQIPELDFSFSGLKTSILYFIQNAGKSNVFQENNTTTAEEQRLFIEQNLHDICASVQNRIVSILINKLKKAVEATGVKSVCIAGGVSANSGLRNTLKEAGEKNNWKTYIPAFEYCTDNAAMISMTAYFKYLEGKFDELNVSSSARAEW